MIYVGDLLVVTFAHEILENFRPEAFYFKYSNYGSCFVLYFHCLLSMVFIDSVTMLFVIYNIMM